MLLSWGELIVSSFQGLWSRFFNFLPNFIGALVVFFFGLAIAAALGKLVTKIARKLWLDRAVKKIGLKETIEEAGVKFDLAGVLGQLVKWFLVIIFLVAVADILKLSQVSNFLNKVLLYLPHVVVAVIILSLGILAGNWAEKIVRSSVKIAKLAAAELVATLAKWAIIIFSILFALVQLKVAVHLIQILFTGLVAMLAIAGGLAFGLGGKETAKEFLERWKKDFDLKSEKKEE